MLVDTCTVEGDVYSYSNHPNVVMDSPYGYLEFDEVDGKFQGKLRPMQVKSLGDREKISEMEFKAYHAYDNLLIPVERVDECSLGENYVVNGRQAVMLHEAKALAPQFLGGGQTQDRIVEVYEGVVQDERDISESREPEYVLLETVVNLFDVQDIERVKVVQ